MESVPGIFFTEIFIQDYNIYITIITSYTLITSTYVAAMSSLVNELCLLLHECQDGEISYYEWIRRIRRVDSKLAITHHDLNDILIKENKGNSEVLLDFLKIFKSTIYESEHFSAVVAATPQWKLRNAIVEMLKNGIFYEDDQIQAQKNLEAIGKNLEINLQKLGDIGEAKLVHFQPFKISSFYF